MRPFLLTGSIICTVLILILGFENLGATASGFLFLFAPIETPFFLIMGLCFLGIITGVFFTLLILNILRSNSEEEEAPGNEW